ncbi:hypothetical protein CTheo_9093 [Ceratobasidium theobromae]|uniref:Uncharacterized protein n=1 Tax=Ceratobasidium theobromae TaxID=1582974 RepID=A0A5N5Q6U2_9AGAM|nr:hypothetical protein CTheo_9093 [Ceratobasidium theobromae]
MTEFTSAYSHTTQGIDFTQPDTIITLRAVFDKSAQHFSNQDSDTYRALCASMRLYSRLPLWSPGSTGACFHPFAYLPAPRWIQRVEEEWSINGGLTSDSLAVIESLISQDNLLWTVGTLRSNNNQTANTGNWYNRSRGLHQIVSLCCGAVEYGPLEARLSKAIRILEDPRLRAALMSLPEVQGNEFRTLITECCASRSSLIRIDYPILSKHLPAWPEYKSVSEMLSQLTKFRTALRSAVLGPNPSVDIPATATEHRISGTIRMEFWKMPKISAWVLGWGAKHPEKDYRTIAALIAKLRAGFSSL